MSLINRLEILEEGTRTKRQRTLIERDFYFQNIADKASSRPELREYIASGWKGALKSKINQSSNAIPEILKKFYYENYNALILCRGRNRFSQRSVSACFFSVRLCIFNNISRGFQPSSDRSSSWFPLTQNLANRAMVRSTISLDLETIMDLHLNRPNQWRCRQ